jgi:hypothetical protein
MVITHLVFFFFSGLNISKFAAFNTLVNNQRVYCMYNLFQCSRAGPVTDKGGQNSAHERNQRISAFQFLA